MKLIKFLDKSMIFCNPDLWKSVSFEKSEGTCAEVYQC